MSDYEFVNKLVHQANTIFISTHIFPDADGIGSQVALTLALKYLGKNVVCINQSSLLKRYRYLDQTNVIHSYHQYSKKKSKKEIDLFIIVDTNSTSRVGSDIQALVEKSKRVLFIDHHPCSEAIAAIHCINTKAAATGEIVGEIIQSFKIPFNQDLALPLYTAILIDTNSFRYPTVTHNTHKLISTLLKTGIRPQIAYNKIYGTKSITHIKLVGHILSSAQTTPSGNIAWIVVDQKTIEMYDGNVEDTHSFINHLLILDKIKVACMFRDVGNKVKISLRSAGDIDVGVIAQALGGGGHNHSAATLVEGKLKEIIPSTIEKIQEMLKRFT